MVLFSPYGQVLVTGNIRRSMSGTVFMKPELIIAIYIDDFLITGSSLAKIAAAKYAPSNQS